MRRICKKYVAGWLAVLMLVSALGLISCGSTAPAPGEDGVLTVVATSFAGFDFARQIIRSAEEGAVKLILLGKPGQDMHSFEPTAADITTLATADVVVCLGGASEAWLEATLKSAMNESVRRVTMTEVCKTMDQTPTEGMDTTGGHDGHDHAEGGACGLIGADEHVWLSPANAIAIASAIGDALCAADADRAEAWRTGTEAYVAELDTLRADYTAMRATAVRDTVLIADRYPFAYLMRDLNITCYAAFPGCSSETSASFETQTFLIEKAKELALPCIFIIDGSDGRVAEVIAAESGAEVLTLDSAQVVTDREKTYVEIMRTNLKNLKKALS